MIERRQYRPKERWTAGTEGIKSLAKSTHRRMALWKLVFSCVQIVCSSWMAAFVTGRIALFHQWYTVHQKDYLEARFVIEELCRNDTIKANLGSRSVLCDDASHNVAIWPIVQAVYSTAERTYLCGNESCITLFHEITSTWTSFVLTIVVTLAISPVLYRKALRWIWGKAATKAHRPTYDSVSDWHYGLPELATPAPPPLILKEKVS